MSVSTDCSGVIHHDGVHMTICRFLAASFCHLHWLGVRSTGWFLVC